MQRRYDEDQQRAINAQDGYYLVLAPPGCGKTDILAERIMRANQNGVSTDEMLCLTFTNRASRGMLNRIRQKLDEKHTKEMDEAETAQPLSQLFVGNIHRYCSKYLFANSVVPDNVSIIDDDDQADLFLTYDKEMFGAKNQRGVNKNAVKYVADLASYIQQSLAGQPEKVKFAHDTYPDLYRMAQLCEFIPEAIPAEKQALRYAIKYIEYKKTRNIIDFQDILILAYQNMVENADHKKYKWIQVDEVQDLNFLQLAIVDQLTAPRATVMYLGDEQQAIFSFMGAKLNLLTTLKNRCKDNLLTLSNNYRSPQYLLEICNEYAEKELGVDRALLPKSDDHTPRERLDIILTESEDAKAEGMRVLNMTKYYLGLDAKERLAILVTKNEDADSISATLSSAGISNFKISGTDMFKTKSYKTLSSYYSVLVNDFSIVAWSRLLYGIGAIPTLDDARNFIGRLKGVMMTPSDLLTDETYLQRFLSRYDTDEFVFFDTETTGLNVFEDDIVQIAAFKVKGGEKVEGSDFDILIETDREIPTMLGEIKNPLVERYATSPHYSREEGLKMFIDYIGDRPVLGHNVTYDYLILKHNVERTLGTQIGYDTFDSLHIIKCVAPGLKKYRLETLLSELGLEGKNSHLANEDIEATKSLVDYCVDKIRPMIPRQEEFIQKVKAQNIKSRMLVLRPLMEHTREIIYRPVSITRHTIADELRYMYQTMRAKGLIKDLGAKYDIFIKFVESEWADYGNNISLYDQISAHIYDITSTINEGDLVNSKELLQDRVFIMTVYKGKGLEFENVVILGAVNGAYPFFAVNKVLCDAGATAEEIHRAQMERKEDARKFYVALSRAKKRLCVSYFNVNQWGRTAGMSPFMKSIIHHFHYFKGR